MLARKKPSSIITALLLASALSACGGGGGGETPTPTPTPTAEITLDSITGDDSLSATEAMGSITITGSTGGNVVDGDIATLTVNGKTYTGVVVANRFSIEILGADLAASSDVFASVTTVVAATEVTAETARAFSVTSPTVSLSIDLNFTGDNVINIEESQQNISVTGIAEGDVFDGDLVTVSVSSQTYAGALSGGAFDIVVPGSVLVTANELTVSIETTTGSSFGESSSSDTLAYTVSLAAPQISIIFPWDSAVVESQMITVTAVIVDDGEIEEVLLNGSAVQDITDTTSIPELDQARLDNPNSRVMVVSSEVALPLGESTVSISASDTTGNIASPEAIAVTRIVDIPNYLFDDFENNRFIGPIPSFDRQSLWVGIDKTSLQITELSPIPVSGSVHSVHSESGIIYSAQRSNDGQMISIMATSLDSFTSSVLISFDDSIIPDGWRFTGIFDMHLNDVGDTLYLMDTLIPPADNGGDGAWQPIFFSFDIELSEISVLSGPFDGDDSIAGNEFAFAGDHLLLVIRSRNRASSNELMKININDGSKEVVVADLGFSPTEITIDRENNIAYMLGLGDRDSAFVNLETYEVTMIPTSRDDASVFALPQPRDAVLDSENGRILIGDSDLPYITTIDVSTGVRGSYTDSGRVGEGTAIAIPSDVYVTGDQSTAYILSGGYNQSHKLLSVDMVTGDRSIVFSLPFYGSSGLSLSIDEDESTAYVTHNNSVYLVDLESGSSAVIASATINVGTGASIETIEATTLTSNENELIVAYNDGELLSLNITTLHRSHLVSTGLGSAVRDLEYDRLNNRIFITTNNAGIFTFSIEGNETSVLLNECLDELGSNWMADHGYVHTAGYDAQNNRLVISGPQYLDTYAEIQLDDLSCEVYSGVSFNDAKYLESGDILAVRKNEMILLEASTQGEVILSK